MIEVIKLVAGSLLSTMLLIGIVILVIGFPFSIATEGRGDIWRVRFLDEKGAPLSNQQFGTAFESNYATEFFTTDANGYVEIKFYTQQWLSLYFNFLPRSWRGFRTKLRLVIYDNHNSQGFFREHFIVHAEKGYWGAVTTSSQLERNFEFETSHRGGPAYIVQRSKTVQEHNIHYEFLFKGYDKRNKAFKFDLTLQFASRPHPEKWPEWQAEKL